MSYLSSSQLLVISLLILQSVQINKTCQIGSKESICPINSFCNTNNYCECNQGWVLGCDVPSIPLTQNFQQFQLSEQQPLNFTIIPSSKDAIFVFRFEICLDGGQVVLNLSLFADEGTQSEFNKDNLIGQRNDFKSISQCWPLFSPYMQFDTQQNGKIEQMILQVKTSQIISNIGNLIPYLQPQKIVGQQKIVRKMNIKVFQLYFLNKGTLTIIIISFFIVIGVSFLIGIAYCIYAIRRGSRKLLDNNLKHFQKLIPKQKLKANDENLSNSCAVCLLDFEIGESVRKTLCNHVFHCQCLDVWCKKNLTCPVCRNSLSKQSLTQLNKQKKAESILTNCQSNINTDLQNLNQALRQDKSNIRSSLKQNQNL